MERITKLAALCTLSFLGITLGVVSAQAQDTPPPPAPTTPAEPGASPPAEPAPPPPGVVVPSDTPSASPPTPPAPSPAPDVAPTDTTPPAGATPPTGAATFEPLPDDASPTTKHPKKAHPSAPRAAAPQPAPVEPAAAPEASVPPADQPIGPRNPEPESPPEPKDDDSGLFGPFRIGFLVGGGVPDLVSLSGMVKLTRYFGAGVNVGLIPTVKISLYGDATLSFQEYDLYGHIFPFGGAFFMGAGVGYANVHGTIASRYTIPDPYYTIAVQTGQYKGSQTPEIDSQGNVRTLVLTPQIGLLKTFQAGFSIGIDVGAQVPIAPSQVDFSTTVPPGLPPDVSASVTKADGKVRSTLTSLGRTVVPTVGVKLGWLL